jgi:hypothetical protein
MNVATDKNPKIDKNTNAYLSRIILAQKLMHALAPILGGIKSAKKG